MGRAEKKGGLLTVTTVATFTPVATVVTLTNTVPWNITLELSSRLSIFIETDKSHA